MAITSLAPLPVPADRPDADVVIFDGQCRFCRAQVDRLHRVDLLGRLSFISLHDPLVHDRWPDLDHEMLMEQMYVMTRGGRRYAGAAALRYLSRRLALLWPVAPLLHIPGTLGLWQWLYRKIATRRYRLAGQSCDDGSCSVHADRAKLAQRK